MSKKIMKVMSVLIIMLLMFSVISPAFAYDPKSFTPEVSGTAQDKVIGISENLIGIVQIIGTAVAIIMLIYIGIKYVVASPQEKGELKHTALIYVIAAIFIFAAANILAVVKNFAEEATDI